MFGNCFFPLFSILKNNFLFFRLKNLFGNSKWIENKNFFFFFEKKVFQNKKEICFFFFRNPKPIFKKIIIVGE